MPFAYLTICLAALLAVGVAADDGQNATVINCHPDNFQDGANCTLVCAQPLPADDFVFVDSDWTYTTSVDDTGGRSVMIFDGVSYTVNDSVYEAKLTLTNYSAGYYNCRFTFANETDVAFYVYPLQIGENVDGSDIGQTCTNASECWALNAQCDNTSTGSNVTTCNCNGYFDVPYDNNYLTPGCLQHVDEYGNCSADVQCDVQEQSFACVTHVCTCVGRMIHVKERNDTLMCLKPKQIYQICTFNEECFLGDSHSLCVNGICECEDGYSTERRTYCADLISIGAIVGIAVGIVIGFVAVIVAIAICCCRKNKGKPRCMTSCRARERCHIVTKSFGQCCSQHDSSSDSINLEDINQTAN